MGPQLQYLETVLTCTGNYYAPDLHNHVDDLKKKLQQLIADDTNNLVLKKVEPWNSVRVTFNMPVEAARRLKELAERRDSILRELGILAVQIEGDQVISLTLESKSSDPSSAEVVVSFPAQLISETEELKEMTVSNHLRLEEDQALERTELSATLATDSAAHASFISPSINPVFSFYKEKTEKRPVFVESIYVPASRTVDRASSSSSAALIHNSPNVNHLIHAQLVAFELQSLQQQFEQRSNFLSDISSQTSNGFGKPACAQTRLNPEEGRTMPVSLGILHSPAGQNPPSRVWSRVDDRLPINNNNIASSSPLLVNLLKSPGGRHPQPNLLVPRAQTPDLWYPGVAVPQKRRRSQQRTPKRPKIDLEGKKPSDLCNASAHLDAVGSSLISQVDILSKMRDDESVLDAVSNSRVAGLTIDDPLLSFTTTACLDSKSRQRFMINPYTGDLEAVNETDDGDGGQEASKETSSWQNALASVSYMTSGSISSTQASLSGCEENIHKNATVTTQSLSLRCIANDHSGNNANADVTMSQLSDISTGLDVKDMAPTCTSFKSSISEGSLSSSDLLNTCTSVPSLSALSKPRTVSTAADLSHLHNPSSLQVSLLASAAFHAKSSIFQHVVLSHSDDQETVNVVQPNPISSSRFGAVCTNQMTADALPVPGVSSLSQFNEVAVTSSFHQICSIAMHQNRCSIVDSSLPLKVVPSSVQPSVLTPNSVVDEDQKVDATDLLCRMTGAEGVDEQLLSSRAAAAAAVDSAATLSLGQMQPVVCSAVSLELPFRSQGCLLQIDKTERDDATVDIVKSSASDVQVNSAVCLQSFPPASQLVTTYPSACVANVSSVATGTHNALPGNVIVECSLKPETGEGISSHFLMENNCTNDMKVPLTFPFHPLPQDLLSLSVAFSQNGRLPVMSCLPNLPRKSLDVSKVIGDCKVSRTSSSPISQTDADASVLISPLLLQKDSKDGDNADDGKFHIYAPRKELTLPPENATNSSPLPQMLSSKKIDGDKDVLPSSSHSVHASDTVHSRVTIVSQVEDTLSIPDDDVLVRALPDTSLSFTSPCDAESVGIADQCSMFGQSSSSAESIFVAMSSSSGQPTDFSQQNVLCLANQQSLPDAFQPVMRPEAVGPLQSFFQLPISSSHVTWDTKLMLPVGNLKAMSGAGVANSTAVHSAFEAESALAAFEKLACLSSLKPAVAIGSMLLNPLCLKEHSYDQSVSAVDIKLEDELKRTAEQTACTDPAAQSGEGSSSSATMPIGLQDIIVMQVSSGDLQTSGSSSHLIPSLPFAGVSNSEQNVSEVNEDALAGEVLKVPPFAGPAVRLALYPETKMFVTRESCHRKSSRSSDESSPRSKATLTVAKLLEKADSAKMNIHSTNKLTESTVSMENTLRQSTVLSHLPFPDSLPNTTAMQVETTSKLATVSPSVAKTNFGGISVNCLPSKLSLNLPTSLSKSFSMMDTNPLSITAPSYPLDLTESVKKAMQGVGLDTSPPPSPKPSTSNRLSPVKFGGVLTSAGQSRSYPSYVGTLSGSIISENKLKDSTIMSPDTAASLIVTPTASIPDCHQTAVSRLLSNSDLVQHKVDNSSSQPSIDEDMSSVLGQSDAAESTVTLVTTEERISSEGRCTEPLEVNASQPINVAVFCSVDHSYSALPDPLGKKSFAEKSNDDFCNSIKDLPEHLNSVEDCHDADDQFFEITETLVNHFEDEDLFIDDLLTLEGISSEYLNDAELQNSNESLQEEVEECIVDPLQELLSSNLADCSEELLTDDTLQHQKESIRLKDKKTTDGEHRKDKAEMLESDNVNVAPSEDFVMTDAVVALNEDHSKLSKRVTEQMATFEKKMVTVSECPVDANVSSVDKTFVVCATAKDVAHSETGAGDCVVASDCRDNIESEERMRLPLQRSRLRKGLKDRERRGGRFVRSKLEQYDESEKMISTGDSFERISNPDAVSNESLSSVDSKGSFVAMESLKPLPSSGCMTTRSVGRRNTRTGKKADLLTPDLLATSVSWTENVTSQRHLSPALSKLNENTECLVNPILLRRSTRTLRKGESASSGEPNNGDHAVKTVATRQRRRVAKGNQSVKSRAEQNILTEMSEGDGEVVDCSQLSCTTDSNRTGIPDHEEPATSKGKELPARKSKT